MERKSESLKSILTDLDNKELTKHQAHELICTLLDVSDLYCDPPNLTYCKQSIYPDFDCNTCKHKIQYKD